MQVKGILLVLFLVSPVVFSISSPARAQSPNTTSSGTVAGPDYTDSSNSLDITDTDARPGVYFFGLGVKAFKKGDYGHAMEMYKVAASWAYKPAQYNLALMYFKGEGVSVDRPLGAAWMVLAAERGDSYYVKARDLMISLLTKTQFARSDELWGQLKQTYGDKVALTRAKARWVRVGRSATGSHLGHGMGNLRVGDSEGSHSPAGRVDRSSPKSANAITPFDLLQDGSVDGSVAYQQFQQSDDPYDRTFNKNRKGTVKVESLTPVKSGGDKHGKKDGPDSSAPNQPDTPTQIP